MNTGCGFDRDHFIQWGSSIDSGSSNLKGIIFQDDPELGTIDIPTGRIKFLTPIGITLSEHKSANASGPEGLYYLCFAQKNRLA